MADKKQPKRPPATTVEARENQLINMAYELAEQQLLDGTASSQVTTHFLKLGTTQAALEKEKLRNENILLEARANAIESSARMEGLYEEAIKAFKLYGGQEVEADDED